MSEKAQDKPQMMVLKSTRFGDMEVPAESVIEFPSGMIGFPNHRRFVMLDHKPPFAWLHSTEDPNLAFVVIDGAQFTQFFEMKAPFGDRDTDLKSEDDYAILVVVTVRPDPRMTTANVKAPLFVNIRNRKGVQVIYDDPKFPTRFHLWGDPEGLAAADAGANPAAPGPEKKDTK